MIAFLDFEASSLSDDSYPVEVGWVFEDGRSEAYLIRPAPEWTEWDPQAEAIHGISRADLLENGTAHDTVAQRMVEALTGHDLCASAPSWDGKWLSALLRAAGLPRRALRLRDTDEVLRETASAILVPSMAGAQLGPVVEDLIARQAAAAADDGPPAHRALADAEHERRRWLKIRGAARSMVTAIG
ncbi:transcriptional regulator [Altericroceibacterium xinjiangense]|uniref:3'-5' exonuclease n=1 Tax=Altericroceibacterium xinjiangense TaxID=762261 RepID=UPI000F7EA416|nr:transcriptional regulator [Altericroceibacterium xinjiangense]